MAHHLNVTQHIHLIPHCVALQTHALGIEAVETKALN